MSADFDPYYRWLGIPAKDQPAHLYRLLGLTEFESDPDVIAMAADRQMAYVRNFQSGQYDRFAEALLNELAAAQVCLLNKTKKAAYDQKLRQQLAALAPQPAKASPPVLPPPAPLTTPNSDSLADVEHLLPTPQPIPATLAAAYSADGDSNNDYSWAKLSSDSPLVWQLPLAGLVFLLVFVVGWQVSRQIASMNPSPAPEVVVNDPPLAPRRDLPAEVPAEVPDAEPAPAPEVEPVAPLPAIESDPAPPPKAMPTPPPEPKTDVVSTPVKPQPPAPSTTDPFAEPSPPEPEVVTPAPAARSLLPDDAAVALARKAMLDVYAKDFAAATSLPQRKLLAEKLLQEARKYNDDPAGAYVLLMEARGLTIEIGQPKLLLEVVDDLISRYGLDSLSTKAAALTEAVPQLKATASHAVIAEQAIALIDEALASENYALARQLVTLGLSSANKSNDRDSIKEMTSRQEELVKFEALLAKVAAAERRLADEPNHEAACLFLGQYLCVSKNDWSAGLPILARAADTALGQIAAADLAVASDATERALLGDRWWTYAHSDAPGANEFLRRALYWYKQALPELMGLVHTQVSNRLDQAWTGPTGGPEPAIAPLAASIARDRQVKWSQWLKQPVVKTNALGMKLMLIPPGQFRMGTEAANTEEERRAVPKHTVRITKPFYVGSTEVTLGQFAAFVKATSYTSELERRDDEDDDNRFDFGRGRGRGNRGTNNTPIWLATPYVQTAEHPVVRISWNDAVAFCKWLSIVDGVEYSLPSEAQWEYICRAGTETYYSFGDRDVRPENFAWHFGNTPKSAQRVGQKRPNAWGVRDIHGNAAEWCADWHGDYSEQLVENPPGADFGSSRVVRGGSWGDRALPGSAARERWDPSSGHDQLGFRVVCTIDTTVK